MRKYILAPFLTASVFFSNCGLTVPDKSLLVNDELDPPNASPDRTVSPKIVVDEQGSLSTTRGAMK